jgi:hypothetical protein
VRTVERTKFRRDGDDNDARKRKPDDAGDDHTRHHKPVVRKEAQPEPARDDAPRRQDAPHSPDARTESDGFEMVDAPVAVADAEGAEAEGADAEGADAEGAEAEGADVEGADAEGAAEEDADAEMEEESDDDEAAVYPQQPAGNVGMVADDEGVDVVDMGEGVEVAGPEMVRLLRGAALLVESNAAAVIPALRAAELAAQYDAVTRDLIRSFIPAYEASDERAAAKSAETKCRLAVKVWRRSVARAATLECPDALTRGLADELARAEEALALARAAFPVADSPPAEAVVRGMRAEADDIEAHCANMALTRKVRMLTGKPEAVPEGVEHRLAALERQRSVLDAARASIGLNVGGDVVGFDALERALPYVVEAREPMERLLERAQDPLAREIEALTEKVDREGVPPVTMMGMKAKLDRLLKQRAALPPVVYQGGVRAQFLADNGEDRASAAAGLEARIAQVAAAVATCRRDCKYR